MTEKDVRSILLFFYFAFLDSQKAKEFAIEATQLFKKYLIKHPSSPQKALVWSTFSVWKKHHHKFSKGRANYQVDPSITLKAKLDINSWIEFQKHSQDDQLVTIIWGKILKISDEDISASLQIPVGTVRYRLNQALKKLGSYINARGSLQLAPP